MKIKIVLFEEDDKKEPFTEWILSLDSTIKKRILVRITRLQAGNFGDCKKIGNDIYELRCFFGSGYRVYFGQDHKYIIVLLCGGDKSSQRKDINKAKRYWSKYNERKNQKSKQL